MPQGTLSEDQTDNIVSAHGEGIRKAIQDSGGARSFNRPPIYLGSAGCPTKSALRYPVESITGVAGGYLVGRPARWAVGPSTAIWGCQFQLQD